jgi:hypothetical protein
MNNKSLKIKKDFSNKLFYNLSLLIGLALIIFSYGKNIIDRASYISYIENFPIILINRIESKGLISILFNDPLWLLISGLGYLSNLDSEFYILSLCSLSFLVSMRNINKSEINFLKLLPIILSAAFLVNFITHIRQGFALSTLIYSLNINYKNISVRNPFLIWVSFLIHNSFLFVNLFFLYDKFIKSKYKYFAIIIIPFLAFIYVSNGRQDYLGNDLSITSIGFGWLYWFVVFLLLLLSDLNKQRLLLSKEKMFILFYLIAYLITPMVAGRLMEVLVLFIFISIEKKFEYRTFQILAYSYFVLSWVNKFNFNYFGFAAA